MSAKPKIETWFGHPEGLGGAFAGIVMAHENGALNAAVVAELELRPDDEVLEIGCGPGIGVRTVAEHVPTAFAAAVDPSELMVQQAKRRNQKHVARGAAEIRVAAAETLPYPDARFKCAFSVNSLHHWDRVRDGLAEAFRVLAPGGPL